MDVYLLGIERKIIDIIDVINEYLIWIHPSK